jgi:AAA domain
MILQNTDETILCVCYTNHALDQFLEYLLDSGEKRLVRLGGRTKSTKLEALQLKVLARTKTDSPVDTGKRIRQIDGSLHNIKDVLESELKELRTEVGWSFPRGGIERLLAAEYPQIYRCLHVPSRTDGFTMVEKGGKDMKGDYLFNCWKRGESFPTSLAHLHRPEFDMVWGKALNDRLDDLRRWRREILSSSVDTVRKLVEDISQLLQEKKEIRQCRDLDVLRRARVIGATTSGAATYQSILSSIGPGVIVVEEAGEVLESHVLTAMSEKTKHLILIGDHKQLRPKVETYKLSIASGHGYDLDCSLFERLVTNNLPSVALEVQHRMRPEISRIIRAQTYPMLRDHKSVFGRPDVKGASENVFFLDHKFPEVGEDDGTSKKNFHEAELCVELVRFFILQGYRPDQIVVVTPYLGQLLLLLQHVKSRLQEVTAAVSDNDLKELEEEASENDGADLATAACSEQTVKTVRCSSVDNFQGEEADIIIVSLVRSNARGVIGFLKEEQRVNVLLSRARSGMFIVGNTECLTKSNAGSAVWGPILNLLSVAGQVRPGLPTLCQLHPDDDPIELRTPEDFRLHRPNGGCSRQCDFRMPCGHPCPKMCHPVDRLHIEAQRMCVAPCRRFPLGCKLNHPCQKMCKEECGSCETRVGPVDLLCGHSSHQARCFEVGSEDALKLFSSRCREEVVHTFAGCMHSDRTTCSNARSSAPQCPSFCGKAAKCGHSCRKM